MTSAEEQLPEVIEYPSFPAQCEPAKRRSVEKAAPSIDDIKRQTLKSMVRDIKPAHLRKDDIMRQIEDATKKGLNQVVLPTKKLRYKEINFFNELGYTIKPGKKNNSCCLFCRHIRIMWR